MLNTYSANDGFDFEEITFGGGVPIMIEGTKTPLFVKEAGELPAIERPRPTPVAAAAPAAETVIETPVLDATPEPPPAAAAPVPKPPPVVDGTIAESVEEKEDEVATRVAGQLAVGLARILENAIRELEKRRVIDLGSLSNTVAGQQQRMDTTFAELVEVKHRIGGLVDTVSAQKSAALINTQRYDELAQGIAALHEAGARQETAIAAVTGRLSEVAGRVEAQQQEMILLQPAMLELSPRVAVVVERLDRQAEAIRSLYQAGTERDATLDQLSDILERLKSSRIPSAAPARL